MRTDTVHYVATNVRQWACGKVPVLERRTRWYSAHVKFTESDLNAGEGGNEVNFFPEVDRNTYGGAWGKKRGLRCIQQIINSRPFAVHMTVVKLAIFLYRPLVPPAPKHIVRFDQTRQKKKSCHVSHATYIRALKTLEHKKIVAVYRRDLVLLSLTQTPSPRTVLSWQDSQNSSWLAEA